jgi:hypothetical protein
MLGSVVGAQNLYKCQSCMVILNLLSDPAYYPVISLVIVYV